MDQAVKSLVVKTVGFLALFVLFHFSYDFFPGRGTAVFSATSEAFFQHQKIGFISYAVASVLEFAATRKRTAAREGFLFSRMLSCVFLPWMMFLIWYLAPAFYGRPMPTDGLEILYGVLMTLVVGVMSVLLEREVEGLRFSKPLRFVIIILFLSSMILFPWFTFRLPWADFFRG
jgi:hypothetical protein